MKAARVADKATGPGVFINWVLCNFNSPLYVYNMLDAEQNLGLTVLYSVE